MSRRDSHPALATQPTCRQRRSSTTTDPCSLALEISHAVRLRQKLAAAGAGRRLVINVWSIGYRLIDGHPHPAEEASR
jgi:DNA-binding response OmpR family regulator